VNWVCAEIDVVLDCDEQGQQIRPRPSFVFIAAQRSKSNGAPRAAIVALTIDVPPTRRPRGTRKLRPPNVPAPSVLMKSQSNPGIPPAQRQWCSPLTVNSGGTACSCGKSGPASISKTLREAFSVRRAATTPPLEPAPTTMTSNLSMGVPRSALAGAAAALRFSQRRTAEIRRESLSIGSYTHLTAGGIRRVDKFFRWDLGDSLLRA